MDLLTSGMDRFPEAMAAQVDSEWWVVADGPGEKVRPRGVDPSPDRAAPRLLEGQTTLHEAFTHLGAAATQPDPAAAAEHLAEHVRRFGLPRLCRHGVGPFHQNDTGQPVQCTPPGLPGHNGPAVRLTHVLSMLTCWDRLADAYTVEVGQRRPLTRAMVDDILAWPVLPDSYTRTIRSETARVGHLPRYRTRQLISMTIDSAMRQSHLRTTLTWRPQRRPELALEADDLVGLYLADLVAAMGLIRPDRSFVCSVCGLPFTPKRAPRAGHRLVCRRPECQRERERLKKAHQRGRQED